MNKGVKVMSGAESIEAKYTGVALPEVRITTERMMSADTTEMILNALSVVDSIRQITVTGESLPATVNSGPNKGIANNHTERKTIKFKDQEIVLRYLVGDIFIELFSEDEEMLKKSVDQIGKICEETLPFGFTIDVGRYSKYRPTLRDYRGV